MLHQSEGVKVVRKRSERAGVWVGEIAREGEIQRRKQANYMK